MIQETSTTALPYRTAGYWLRIVLLPLVLIVISYWAFGFYYETNDDPTLMLLVRGISAAKPVTNLYLYLHGWSYLLAQLYTWQPLFPWYDALLIFLTYISLVCLFVTIDWVLRARSWSPVYITLGLTGFYLCAFLPHLIYVNFTRPAVLLGVAAGAVLVVASSRRFYLGLGITVLLFVAGWGVRFSGAELGLLLLVPLWLVVLPVRRVALAVVVVGVTGVGLHLALQAQETAASRKYAELNTIRTQAFDYQAYEFHIKSPADSLALSTLEMGMGPYDPQLITDAFLQRSLIKKQVPLRLPRLKSDVITIIFDLKTWKNAGLLLVGLGLCMWLAAVVRRRPQSILVLIGLYQVFFWVLYFGVALRFHLVARVAQPMMTAYFLVNLVLLSLAFPRSQSKPLRWFNWAGAGLTALLILICLRGARQESIALRRDEQFRAEYLAALQRVAAGQVLVEGGLYNVLDHLLLFKPYNFSAYRHIVTLGGWSIYDPSQIQLRWALTGYRDTPRALHRLAYQPQVVWLMRPNFVRVMNRYFDVRDKHEPHPPRLRRAGLTLGADSLAPAMYRVE